MTSIFSDERSAARQSRRPALTCIAANAAFLLLCGCTGDPISGLKPVDCAASDIVLTLSNPQDIEKTGSQHTDSITVKATCSKPAPGGPLVNAAIRVQWPGGTSSTGTTDSTGTATITSSPFPTSSGPGTALVSVNGDDNKSQNEKDRIP